jgi:hypothetical protein
MDTLTLPQARLLLEQALQRVDSATPGPTDAADLGRQAQHIDHPQRMYLWTLESCIEQFDALLADMDESGLDAVPEGAAVRERIQVERQEVVDGITRNAR